MCHVGAEIGVLEAQPPACRGFQRLDAYSVLLPACGVRVTEGGKAGAGKAEERCSVVMCARMATYVFADVECQPTLVGKALGTVSGSRCNSKTTWPLMRRASLDDNRAFASCFQSLTNQDRSPASTQSLPGLEETTFVHTHGAKRGDLHQRPRETPEANGAGCQANSHGVTDSVLPSRNGARKISPDFSNAYLS